MIIFQLECAQKHSFEGWFSDTQDFENQQSRGLLTCPMCNNADVYKVIAGVPFIKSRGEALRPKPAKPPVAKPQPQSQTQTSKPTPVDPVVLMKAVEHFVSKNFENVGKKFYSEAVKMHQGEIDKRNIYGEVTPAEREKLEEENIPFATLPKLGPQFEN